MNGRISRLFVFIGSLALAGCASIGPLEGGKKDTLPPKIVAISPADSQLNTRVTRIELRFDEFIALNDPASEIQISPLLAVPPMVTGINKKVVLKIPDSLLAENTTYRISFGSSVKDIHEDNKISGFTYTFSTGSYFDSLQIGGTVINARTGLPDSSATILLYPASAGDSAVIRSRPLYVGRVGAGGIFSVKGLPGKEFRIYALSDGNTNLIFDGGTERIAFNEELIMPGDSLAQLLKLRTFEEAVDTTADSTLSNVSDRGGLGKSRRDVAKTEDFTYAVGVDTSNVRARSKEIIKPIEITFSKEIVSLDTSRISLATDSTIEQSFTVRIDSQRSNVLILSSNWLEDTVYTLRLLKGFAKDSAGNDALPSKYMFRSKRDDDYSKLGFNIPAKYSGNKYILLVETGKDTVYYKQVSDTTVKINRLMPGNYSARIIVDENENGVWDTGDLLLRRQPEYVIPYTGTTLSLKAGWDNIYDFEPKASSGKRAVSPAKRDRETRK